MRKLIIKYYYLDYMSKFKGFNLKFYRGAAINYPLIVLSGLSSLLFGNSNLVTTLLMVLTFISLFISFYLIDKMKVQFEELTDMEQIYQFGAGNFSGQLSVNSFKPEYMEKWQESRKFVNSIDESNKNYKPWRFIFHPALIFIVLIIVVILTLI